MEENKDYTLVLSIMIFVFLCTIFWIIGTHSVPANKICKSLGYGKSTDYTAKEFGHFGNKNILIECDGIILNGTYNLYRFDEKNCEKTNKWGQCTEEHTIKYYKIYRDNIEIERIRR